VFPSALFADRILIIAKLRELSIGGDEFCAILLEGFQKQAQMGDDVT
jgi:hypothetical protein